VRFAYERIEVDPSPADLARYVYRPVVPLTIFGPAGKAGIKGTLDSGAAETILPAYLADEVGVSLRPESQGVLRGADGRPFVVDYGIVDLSVLLGRTRLRWRATVCFHPHRNDALLGDAGFLRHFTVTLNGPGRYATLQPNGKFPPAAMPTS